MAQSASARRVRKSAGDRAFDVFLYAFAVLLLGLILYPLYFIVIASVSNPSLVAGGRVWFYPVGFNVDGYKALMGLGTFWRGYRNTIAYTAAGTLIGLMVNIPAAFALSRKDLKGRSLFMVYFLITMFFNGGLIPTFLTVQNFGLYDSFWVMVLPFSVAVYNIIVARTFFQNSLPQDMWDAAQIDGCGTFQYFVRIVLPLSKAILAVIALWTAVGHWNSYFNALIYTRSPELYPLQLVLRNLLIVNEQQGAMLGSGDAQQEALRIASLLRYAVIIVSTVPVMCVYPFLQKYFIKGMTIGAIKG